MHCTGKIIFLVQWIDEPIVDDSLFFLIIVAVWYNTLLFYLPFADPEKKNLFDFLYKK